jgi:hypothetical protein
VQISHIPAAKSSSFISFSLPCPVPTVNAKATVFTFKYRKTTKIKKNLTAYHYLPPFDFAHPSQPVLQTFHQFSRIQPFKYPAERVLVRYVIRKFQKLPKPLLPVPYQIYMDKMPDLGA